MILSTATCNTIDANCMSCARPVTVSYTGTAVSASYGNAILCTLCSAGNRLSADGMSCDTEGASK